MRDNLEDAARPAAAETSPAAATVATAFRSAPHVPSAPDPATRPAAAVVPGEIRGRQQGRPPPCRRMPGQDAVSAWKNPSARRPVARHLAWVPDHSDAPATGFLGADRQMPTSPWIPPAPAPPQTDTASWREAPPGAYRVRRSTLAALFTGSQAPFARSTSVIDPRPQHKQETSWSAPVQ